MVNGKSCIDLILPADGKTPSAEIWRPKNMTLHCPKTHFVNLLPRHIVLDVQKLNMVNVVLHVFARNKYIVYASTDERQIP